MYATKKANTYTIELKRYHSKLCSKSFCWVPLIFVLHPRKIRILTDILSQDSHVFHLIKISWQKNYAHLKVLINLDQNFFICLDLNKLTDRWLVGFESVYANNPRSLSMLSDMGSCFCESFSWHRFHVNLNRGMVCIIEAVSRVTPTGLKTAITPAYLTYLPLILGINTVLCVFIKTK